MLKKPSGDTAMHEGVFDPEAIKTDTSSALWAKSLWGSCSSKHWLIPPCFLCGVPVDEIRFCRYCQISNRRPQTTHAYPQSEMRADITVFPEMYFSSNNSNF